jgi:hypothetical protein
VLRKVLRTLSAQEPPLRSVCARAFRHPAILAKHANVWLASCEACCGR